MGNIFAFMGSLAVSLPSRVLASLGLGFVSFAGYTAVIDQLVGDFVSRWSSMGSDVIAYATLAGFTQGFGVILGALVVRGSLASLSVIGKVT